MNLTADFETNNSETECRVWSWGICGIDDYNFYVDGTDIMSFIETIKLYSYEENCTIWFHNLKFDGSFIVYFLLSHGYSYYEDRKKLRPNGFTALISDMGMWYNITICFGNSQKTGTVTINDSLKVLPFSVSDVAASFGLEETKGTIDYDTIRPIGYEPTTEEKDYQHNDCLIMAKALHRMASEGMTRITAGSNALCYYKSITPKGNFKKWFPKLSDDEDSFIRKSYRGGWTYADDRFKGKNIGSGIVLDVNSLYPSRMRYELMPYGNPIYFEGEYEDDKLHPLFIQRLECSFEIKKNKLPTIQIKSNSRFLESEYLKSSNGDIVELTLTSVDLQLFKEHYNLRHEVYYDGYKFKAQCGMFDEYIDYWIERKINCELNGDLAGRTLAKLYQNSLYGKFAKRPKGKSKHPYIENDILHFKLGEEEEQGKLYIPVGTFTTAYARNYTIRSAQKEYKRFMYADTDSLHLKGLKEPENLDIHPTELGKWKHESTFVRAKYLGAKCYVEEEKRTKENIEKYLKKNPDHEPLVNQKKCTILKVTCAGLPGKLHPQVSFDNFKVGAIYHEKLFPKQVPGGVMLVKRDHEIKEKKTTKSLC